MKCANVSFAHVYRCVCVESEYLRKRTHQLSCESIGAYCFLFFFLFLIFHHDHHIICFKLVFVNLCWEWHFVAHYSFIFGIHKLCHHSHSHKYNEDCLKRNQMAITTTMQLNAMDYCECYFIYVKWVVFFSWLDDV